MNDRPQSGLPSAGWDVIGSFDALVDLTLGTWHARAAATQLADLAGVCLPAADQLYDCDDPETISRGVDAEARGPLAVLVAVKDARFLADLLPSVRSIGVLCREDTPIVDENRWTLTYLARLGRRVALIAPPPDPDEGDSFAEALTPDQRILLKLFPGPLPEALANRVGLRQSHPAFLPGADLIINPGLRAKPHLINPGLIAQVARFEADDIRLQTMVQVLGPAYYADAGWLTKTAMELFRAGAETLALRLLARAADVAENPGEQATADLSLQGVRVFAHRFAEAANHPEPGTGLPEAVRDQLAVLKGWGEIAGPDPARGLRRIGNALRSAEAAQPKSVDDLFILNIAALGQLRTGEADLALETEWRIEKSLREADSEPDPRAEFINALNLSRLYRGRGESAAYRFQLDRALATSSGLRSLSDLVQMNLLRAEPGGSDESPQSHVLRAALAWLALSPPEALAVRATRLTGARPENEDETETTVCDALLTRLRTAFPGLRPLPARVSILAIEDLAPVDMPVKMIAIGTFNAAVLLLSDVPAQDGLKPASQARDELAALCFAALAADCPELADHLSPVLGIDTDFGTNIPVGPNGVDRLAFAHDLARGFWCETAVSWTGKERDAAARVARAALSPGISTPRPTADGMVIPYKRYRPTVNLTGPAACFVNRLRRGPARVDEISQAIGLDQSGGCAVALALQVQRIITLEYAKCIPDGIRSPIPAMSLSR